MAQSVLSDGFINLCISTDANFLAASPLFIVEGQANLASGVKPDVAYPINSALDIAAYFEPGCILSEGLAVALEMAPSGVQVMALPRADAQGATAAVYTLPITGPATSDGFIDLFMGEARYAIAIPVANGDTTAIMAAMAQSLFPANFPFTVAVTAAGLSFTANNAGTVGNNLNASVNWTGVRGRFPSGVTVGPLTQATVGAGDPVAPNYAAILGECCSVAHVVLSPNLAWQRGMRDWVRSNWSCDKPQCFGQGYGYRVGTSGQILATFDNSAELCVEAHHPASVSFGWMKAVAYAALSAYSTIGHPELNVQGTTDGVLTSVAIPATCHRPWSPDEYKLLQAQGFVTTGPVTQGGGVLTNLYIYNDTTEWLYDEKNRPNTTFRSTSSRRLAASTAIAVATFLQGYNGLSVYYKNTKIAPGVQGTNKNLMLAGIQNWAKDQVGTLFGEFDNIQTDITLTSDFDTSPPCQGVPGKFHCNMKYRAPVRIANIGVTLVPEQLDNCIR